MSADLVPCRRDVPLATNVHSCTNEGAPIVAGTFDRGHRAEEAADHVEGGRGTKMPRTCSLEAIPRSREVQ